MNQKLEVQLEVKSSKKNISNTVCCIPMQIFTSTRSGRRFLCGYVGKSKRFTCFRLDTIKCVAALEQSEEYDGLLLKLSRNRQYLWGVSFQGTERNHLEKLIMDLQIMEPYENYILDRLKREGRGGTVSKKPDPMSTGMKLKSLTATKCFPGYVLSSAVSYPCNAVPNPWNNDSTGTCKLCIIFTR